jgi:membrane fusion protein, heavy metal efflux system
MIRLACAAIGLSATLLLAACGTAPEPAEPERDARGAHGGRLLESGDLQLEISIFEAGVPPQFRLYATIGGKPVTPQQLQASIELRRVTGIAGGVVDSHQFVAREDYLVSAAEVYEPHSFDVSVRLEHAGKTYQWQYASPEAQVAIDPAVAAAAELTTTEAGPGVIADQLLLYGRIVPDAERQRQVHARFPGPVRSVAVRVGDSVRAGQQLATIESNESLQTYAVIAPVSGVVSARHVNVGESAGDGPLFAIADYSAVWAELAVFPRDRARLRVGQSVEVRAAEGVQRATGGIRHLAVAGGALTALAHVTLDNSGGQWTPGQFVEGQVAVASHRLPLVLPLASLQRVRDWDVVFVNQGETYQALPVVLGRRDSNSVEILEGLQPGARVVTGNSYLVKADIEKSGATHDH